MRLVGLAIDLRDIDRQRAGLSGERCGVNAEEIAEAGDTVFKFALDRGRKLIPIRERHSSRESALGIRLDQVCHDGTAFPGEANTFLDKPGTIARLTDVLLGPLPERSECRIGFGFPIAADDLSLRHHCGRHRCGRHDGRDFLGTCGIRMAKSLGGNGCRSYLCESFGREARLRGQNRWGGFARFGALPLGNSGEEQRRTGAERFPCDMRRRGAPMIWGRWFHRRFWVCAHRWAPPAWRTTGAEPSLDDRVYDANGRKPPVPGRSAHLHG